MRQCVVGHLLLTSIIHRTASTFATIHVTAGFQSKHHHTQRRSFSSALNMARSNYFLIKSEPHEFSIFDLRDCPDSSDEWDGVRNYQARNILRKMKKGDLAFFYHSNCKEPAIVGQAVVAREAAPDQTALDPKSKYFDPKSTPDNCRWDAVRFQLDCIYKENITLKELKALKESDDIIAGMSLFKNSRLSVQEISENQWTRIKGLLKIKENGKDILESS
jgi:predicted RNA-binding protein with PUA-like domain